MSLNFYKITDSAGTVVKTSYTIKPQYGGCEPINNPCNVNGGSGESGIIDSANRPNINVAQQTGNFQGLWCGVTDCFTIFFSTNSTFPHQLLRISTVGNIGHVNGYMNLSASTWTSLAPSIWGVDIGSGGIGGITLFVAGHQGAGETNLLIMKIGGTSLMGIVNTFNSNAQRQSANEVKLIGCWFCANDNTKRRLAVLMQTTGVDGNHVPLEVWNIDTSTSVCTQSGGGVFQTDQAGPVGRYSGDVSDNTGYWLIAFNARISKFDYNTCTEIVSSTYANSGITNYARDINEEKTFGSTVATSDENILGSTFYIHHGNSGVTSVTRLNFNNSGFGNQVNFDSVTGSTISGYVKSTATTSSIMLDGGSHTLLLSGSDVKLKMIFLSNYSATGANNGNTTVCIDTNGDTTTDVCFTDTNGDGVPDAGPAGALGAQRSNANITEFGAQIYCAFGISADACNNKDARTNGVGLMYLFLVIIFSYAVLVTIHHEAQKYLGGKDVQVMDALKINPLLLVVMLIVDIGFTWYLHWISDIIFYTMVVVMAGITAFGIYRQVKGGSE